MASNHGLLNRPFCNGVKNERIVMVSSSVWHSMVSSMHHALNCMLGLHGLTGLHSRVEDCACAPSLLNCIFCPSEGGRAELPTQMSSLLYSLIPLPWSCCIGSTIHQGLCMCWLTCFFADDGLCHSSGRQGSRYFLLLRYQDFDILLCG